MIYSNNNDNMRTRTETMISIYNSSNKHNSSNTDSSNDDNWKM